MPIGRVTQVVDCRESIGMGKGGGIAQRGTISECRYPDVIVVAMSPGHRHVTKPVCDITSALRQGGIGVLSSARSSSTAGSGVRPMTSRHRGSRPRRLLQPEREGDPADRAAQGRDPPPRECAFARRPQGEEDPRTVRCRGGRRLPGPRRLTRTLQRQG